MFEFRGERFLSVKVYRGYKGGDAGFFPGKGTGGKPSFKEKRVCSV